MTIVNDNSRVITKLETSLTDDARVIIYDCHIFIVQATDVQERFFFLKAIKSRRGCRLLVTNPFSTVKVKINSKFCARKYENFDFFKFHKNADVQKGIRKHLLLKCHEMPERLSLPCKRSIFYLSNLK